MLLFDGIQLHSLLAYLDGRPIWCSMNMCTMMKVFIFTTDVRARDPNLRWLNSECRRSLTEPERRAVADMVLAQCRFEDTWSTVPEYAVRIVPTREAERAVVNEYLQDRATIDYAAVDEVSQYKWFTILNFSPKLS
jgi:hypothetical protein